MQKIYFFYRMIFTMAFVFIFLVLSSAFAQNLPQREFPKTDFTKTSISFDEILSGGPPRDGIPAIDRPEFVSVSDSGLELGQDEPLLSIKIGDFARAYPLRVLIWHEIVNDTIDGTPIAVTFCPLCNSAIIFERALGGRVLDFGTTGRLRNSDLLMYDRQTESWWQQVTGEAVIGELTGKKLKVIPARLESWRSFRKNNPNGMVLVPNDDSLRRYGQNPYSNYDESKTPFLYRDNLPVGIPALERVVSLEDREKAWSFSYLMKKKKVELDKNIVLTWEKGQNSALNAREITEGKDVGTVRAMQKIKGEWHDIPYFVEFAFAFHAFFPESPIVKP